MPGEVTISTGARLHFGLLATDPRGGAGFGGVGATVASPGCRVTVARSNHGDQIEAPPTLRGRIEHTLESYRTQCPPKLRPENCRITVDAAISPHLGLGSGTQLGLALAQGLALLTGETDVAVAELAQWVGRGARSAIGLHGFQRGGFLVDGGKTTSHAISPLVARADVPARWRFVLVTPERRPGLSGSDEQIAFARLGPMPTATTGRLCRMVVMELLPSLHAADFARFAAALDEYGRTVGGYFAPLQGGVYADAAIGELAAQLRKEGVRGIAQSSWGPTIAVLAANDVEAERLIASLRDNSLTADCTLRNVAPLNTGAAIQFTK